MARLSLWFVRGLLLAGLIFGGWYLPEAVSATREALEPVADLVGLVLVLLGAAVVVAIWRTSRRECEARIQAEGRPSLRGPVNGGRLP